GLPLGGAPAGPPSFGRPAPGGPRGKKLRPAAPPAPPGPLPVGGPPRPPPLGGPPPRRNHPPLGRRRAAVPVPPAPGSAARLDDDLHEVPGKTAAAPLRDGQGFGRRPAALPARRGDPRPRHRPLRKDLPLVPPPAAGRRLDRAVRRAERGVRRHRDRLRREAGGSAREAAGSAREGSEAGERGA